MMAGLNAGTAFNPLQALGASPASGGQDDLDEVIRRIQQLLNPGAGASSPMRPSPLGQQYMPLSPSPAPPGYRLNENQGPGGLSAPGLPVEAVGDVVDFRKRGLFPQLGTEGARGYSGGANPQGWNVGRSPRTGTPEWNAAYEAQAGLKPGSLEPVALPSPQVLTSRSFWPGSYGQRGDISKAQIAQAIRNRASAEDVQLRLGLPKGTDAYTARALREIAAKRGVSVQQILDETSGAVGRFRQATQNTSGGGHTPGINPALSKPVDPSAEGAWARAEVVMRATGKPTQMHINKWASEIGLKPKQIDQIVRGMRDAGTPVSQNSVAFFVAQMRQKGIFIPE
jgi:hypothetical protein